VKIRSKDKQFYITELPLKPNYDQFLV